MSKSKDLIVLPRLSVSVLKTEDTKEITVGNYEELETKDRTHIIAYPSDPYSEKAVMALILANIPFRVTTLRETHQKPAWVFEANPLGKVPALYVGSESIWDSTTIDEYLNEVYKLGLLPQDPWEKATCRSAVALVENMLFTWKNFTGRATSTAELEQEKKKLKHYLEYIENRAHVDQKWLVGPYFLGEHLSLVDICFAPLFALINITDEILISKDISPILGFGVHEKEKFSKILDWKDSLMNLPTFWLAAGILLGLKQNKLYKDVTTFTKVRQTLKKSVLKNLGLLNGIFYQLYCGYLPSIKTAATAPIEFVKQVGQAFKEVTANQVE